MDFGLVIPTPLNLTFCIENVHIVLFLRVGIQWIRKMMMVAEPSGNHSKISSGSNLTIPLGFLQCCLQSSSVLFQKCLRGFQHEMLEGLFYHQQFLNALRHKFLKKIKKKFLKEICFPKYLLEFFRGFFSKVCFTNSS